MKKILFLTFLLSFGLVNFVHADQTVYGFQDGKFYNSAQKLVFFCFQDGSCFDTNSKPVQITINHPSLPTLVVTTTPTVFSGANPPTPQPQGSCALTAIDNGPDSGTGDNQSKRIVVNWSTANIDASNIGNLYGMDGIVNGVPHYGFDYGLISPKGGTRIDVFNDGKFEAVFNGIKCYADTILAITPSEPLPASNPIIIEYIATGGYSSTNIYSMNNTYPIFAISTNSQLPNGNPYYFNDIKYSIDSSDFNSYDIAIYCGAGNVLINNSSNQEFTPHSDSGYRYCPGTIGFYLKNHHPGKLKITVTDASFNGLYKAIGLPLSSNEITIQ